MRPFRWDPNVQQYRYPNGRFVPRSVVRDWLDRALEREQRKARALGIELRDGQISLMTWRQAMRDTIKNIHIYSAAIAKGGWAQLTQADFGRVGKVVRSEYRYLERFARAIENGLALDGRFQDRIQQYTQAGRDTFYQIMSAAMKEAGFTMEENVLHPAEHCQGEGSCVEQTDRGKVPIGQLIPIGRRRCLRKCKCSLNYS